MGKNVLLNKIGHGENFLILYDDISINEQIFRNFARKAAENNSIIFYVSHNTNQLNFDFDVRNYPFNIISENVIHNLKDELYECFNEVEKSGKDLLLLSDWSKANLNTCNIFIPFLEELVKRSQGLSPPGWKKKYKGRVQKAPFTLVNAFETKNLDEELIRQLLCLHKKVYLLQKDLNTFLLPTISPSSERFFPQYHVLPQQVLEKLVKDNLKIVTLLLLEKGNKSGYQILKDIAGHFHCVLSQGTLYPLLYQLEKGNKIEKHNGKGREVVYSLTQEMKNNLQSEKEACLKSYQYLANFFG